MEALHHGCPTICSTRGALPEAGLGFTEDIDPDDLDGLVATRRATSRRPGVPPRGRGTNLRLPDSVVGRHLEGRG